MRNRVVRTVDVPHALTGGLVVRAEIVRSVTYDPADKWTPRIAYGVRYVVAAGEPSAALEAFERQLLAEFRDGRVDA